MSAIKDLYDLSKELKENITDRKMINLIMPIIDKIHEAEREIFDMERTQYNLERKHHEEIDKLKVKHDREIAELNKKISNLETKLDTKAKPFVSSIPISRG